MKFSKYLPYLGLIALILFLITDTSIFIKDISSNTENNLKQTEGSHKEGSHKEGSNGQDISQKDKEKKMGIFHYNEATKILRRDNIKKQLSIIKKHSTTIRVSKKPQ